MRSVFYYCLGGGVSLTISGSNVTSEAGVVISDFWAANNSAGNGRSTFLHSTTSWNLSSSSLCLRDWHFQLSVSEPVGPVWAFRHEQKLEQLVPAAMVVGCTS